MTKVYLENDLGIDMLFPIDKGQKMHPVSKGSSLYLKQTPNSMRFIWRKKGKDIPAGKLKAAAKKGGKLGQRARLAITLKGMRKK